MAWQRSPSTRVRRPAPAKRRLTCPGRAISFPRMIRVTESAVQQLRSLLATHGVEAGKGLRVQVVKGGCSGMQYEMSLDQQQEGDAVVQREEVEFFVDPESAGFLHDATLDFADGLTGAGFRILNPNAARTCGCGTSFEPVPSV